MANIGIIGWGVVGQATGKGFSTDKRHNIFWYDKHKKSPYTLKETVEKSEFIFICVPTPVFSDYSGVDVSIVDSVVDEVAPLAEGTRKIVVVKSTVLPGSVRGYFKKYPRVRFAMNPEFLTQKNAEKDFLNPTRTVIGVFKKEDGLRLEKLHKSILPKKQKYIITDPTTAELGKYMSNVMLAAKVLLANEFYQLAKVSKVDYKGVKQIVEADPRIGGHIDVPGSDGNLGFGGACFPKDTVGILGYGRQKKVDLSALEAIWKKNLKIRKVRDWEKMKSSFKNRS